MASEVVLLGAGASVEAGVPAAIKMTQAMLDLLTEQDSHRQGETSPRAHLLRFVVGGLLFQNGTAGRDPQKTGVNIEAVFNAIDLLDRRHEVEFAPFVAAWHPVVEQLSRPRTDRFGEDHARGNQLENALAGMFRGSPFASRDLARVIHRMIDERVKADNSLFRETLRWMISALVRMVRIDSAAQAAYLEPLVRVAGDSKRIIATLNYDTSVELAAEAAGVVLGGGVEEWVPAQYPRIQSGVQLLKLHGSINWLLCDGGGNADGRVRVQVVPDDEVGIPPYFPAVIFGGANKLTARGPFLDLLTTFRAELADAEQLTVIGYSFADDHINDCLAQWLTVPHRVMRIINGPDFGESAGGFASEILRPRFQERRSCRVENLRVCAGEGIRQCFGGS